MSEALAMPEGAGQQKDLDIVRSLLFERDLPEAKRVEFLDRLLDNMGQERGAAVAKSLVDPKSQINRDLRSKAPGVLKGVMARMAERGVHPPGPDVGDRGTAAASRAADRTAGDPGLGTSGASGGGSPAGRVDFSDFEDLLSEFNDLQDSVRITPRKIVRSPDFELQIYLELRLKKALAATPKRKGFHARWTYDEVEKAIESSKLQLLKMLSDGVTVSEIGISGGGYDIDLKWTPKVRVEPKKIAWGSLRDAVALSIGEFQLNIATTLIPWEGTLGGKRYRFMFDAALVVQIIPNWQRILARVLVKIQLRNIPGKSNVVTRILRAVGRHAKDGGRVGLKALARISLRLHDAARAVGRGAAKASLRVASVASKALYGLAVGAEGVIFLLDLLDYLGTIHLEVHRKDGESRFWASFIDEYHGLATHPNRRKAFLRAGAMDRPYRTFEGLTPGVTLTEAAATKIVAQDKIVMRNYHAAELDSGLAMQQGMALWKALDRLEGKRKEEAEWAVDNILRAAGRAFAYQLIAGYIETQTFQMFEEQVEHFREGVVNEASFVELAKMTNGLARSLKPRDGFDAWHDVAEGYVAYVEAMADAHDIPSQGRDVSLVPFRTLLWKLFMSGSGHFQGMPPFSPMATMR